jgi:hypothetical protein
MKCGWGCGAQLTGLNIRAHFTIFASLREAVSTDRRRRDEMRVPTGAADAGRLGTPHRSHRPPDAQHFTICPRPAALTRGTGGGTRELSAAARWSGECHSLALRRPNSRRARCGRTPQYARSGRKLESCAVAGFFQKECEALRDIGPRQRATLSAQMVDAAKGNLCQERLPEF